MNMKLKKIKDQIIVITGASSGIGLATAKLAAARGARVVLASRNREELHRITTQLNKNYGNGQQKKTPGPLIREDALFSHPRREGKTSGDYDGHVARSSAYTATTLHPMKSAALLLSAVGAIVFILGLNRGSARLSNFIRSDESGPKRENQFNPQLH